MVKILSLLYGMLVKLFSFLPMKKIFLYESNPDYTCNTYPVFLELKKKAPNYKHVWMVSKKTPDNPLVDDVVYYGNQGFKNACKLFYYRLFSRVLISCNRYIRRYRKSQISLFLTHGSKTKKTRGIYEMGDRVDYVLVQSHFFDDIICYEYNLVPEQLVYLGYPRNDILFAENGDVGKQLGLPDESRYVIWLPTFRKSIGATDEQDTGNNLGMPILYSVEALKAFNEYLQENNLYVLYKPHPAQVSSVLKASSLSHVRIIDDDLLRHVGLQLSQVLAGSSALLTDYSSVFFDYILLDKPIGTTTDDINAWKEERGFAFDLDAMYDKSTTRIPDYDSLVAFLDDVVAGQDEKKDERRSVCELTNMYRDGNSAKRVAEFIMEKIDKNR